MQKETKDIIKDAIEKRKDDTNEKLEAFSKSDLKRSPQLIYKWMNGDEDNPLDHIIRLYECTNDDRIIGYLCKAFKGYFVKNSHDDQSAPSVNRLISELLHLVNCLNEANEDNYIDVMELIKIEDKVQEIKSLKDTFINYNRKRLLDEHIASAN